MQITEVTIHPTNEGLLRAYVNIVFDNCLMIWEIRVIEGPAGLFVSMPAKKQRDGTHRQLAYPANAETRIMIQRVILAEYESKHLTIISPAGLEKFFEERNALQKELPTTDPSYPGRDKALSEKYDLEYSPDWSFPPKAKD
jgi:stage V sporulation protein G